MENFIIGVNLSDGYIDTTFAKPVMQHIPYYTPDVSALGAMA
jgi:hypothetical protein